MRDQGQSTLPNCPLIGLYLVVCLYFLHDSSDLDFFIHRRGVRRYPVSLSHLVQRVPGVGGESRIQTGRLMNERQLSIALGLLGATALAFHDLIAQRPTFMP